MEWWTTGEAGGTTALVFQLDDGRVVEVSTPDGPFVIDEPSNDDDDGDHAQPAVEVDGLWIGVWASADQRLDGEPPAVDAECGPALDDLSAACRRLVARGR